MILKLVLISALSQSRLVQDHADIKHFGCSNVVTGQTANTVAKMYCKITGYCLVVSRSFIPQSILTNVAVVFNQY